MTVSNTTPRDSHLLDALESLPVVPVERVVWRVVREGRDPCRCSAAGNRWDDGHFDVLYTSCTRGGAVAEMHYHLSRGQPVFPSKLRYSLHQIRVSLDGVYDLSSPQTLRDLGVDMDRFGQLSYADRKSEYLSNQQVADAAHFLGSIEPGDASGILVPNARYDCPNLVIFCSHTMPGDFEAIADHGLVDWKERALM